MEMRTIPIFPIFQVDAFASNIFGGNPAAVCPLDRRLPETVLQSIAAENNLSETAFIMRVPDEADSWHIRWFTPRVEVDLCGHATLAAAWVIFERIGAAGDVVVFHSASGPLRVTRDAAAGDGRLTMDFPVCPFVELDDIPGDLSDALGVRPDKVIRSMDLMAVYPDEETVLSLQPDFRKLAAIETRGVIATARGRGTDFVSRFFAPRAGIDEDPVTGSAHCIMAPWWARELEKSTLTARQLSRRGGELVCDVKGDRVHISGVAVLYLEGAIRVPV